MSIFKTYEIEVDMVKENQISGMRFSQGDLNTAKLLMRILQNGEKMNITGLVVRLALKKLDDKRVYQDCTLVDAENGIVEVILASQSLAKAGVVKAELTLTQGNKAMVSTKFDFNVESPIMNDNAIKSMNDIPFLQKAIEMAELLNNIDLGNLVTDSGVNPDNFSSIQEAVAFAESNNYRSVGNQKAHLLTETVSINPNKTRLIDMRIDSPNDIIAINIFDPVASNNEPDMLYKITNPFERLTLIGNKKGTAFKLGGEGNFWSGSQVCVRDFKIRKFHTCIDILSNSYMLLFENGSVSENCGPCVKIGRSTSNSGEMVVFRNVYFFNNRDTIIDNPGFVGKTVYLDHCSLDYSKLAVLAQNTGRVILNKCWIETNAAQTPEEFFKALSGGTIIFDECEFVIGGDWSNRYLILNDNATIIIRGGRYHNNSNIANKPLGLVREVGNAITKINGLEFSEGIKSPLDLADSLNKVLNGSFSSSDLTMFSFDGSTREIVTVDNTKALKLTADGTAQNLKYFIDCEASKNVIVSFKYKTENVVLGSEPGHGFLGRICYKDKTGKIIGHESLTPIITGTNDWVITNRQSVKNAFTAPKGTHSFELRIGFNSASSGIAWVTDLKAWVV